MRHRQGRRYHHQRSRRRLVGLSDHVHHAVPRQSVFLRLGADEKSERRDSVDSREWRGIEPGAGRTGPDCATCAVHVHDRSRAQVRPQLSRDHHALETASGAVQDRFRKGLVQAHPSRLGAACPLCRCGNSERRPDLAGSPPQGQLRHDRCNRCSGAGSKNSGIGRAAAGTHQNGLGLGGHVPLYRLPRWRERGAYPPRAGEGLERQRSEGTRYRVGASRGDPEGLQPCTHRRQAGLAGRPHCSRWRRRRGTGGEESGRHRCSALHARSHGCVAESD